MPGAVTVVNPPSDRGDDGDTDTYSYDLPNLHSSSPEKPYRKNCRWATKLMHRGAGARRSARGTRFLRAPGIPANFLTRLRREGYAKNARIRCYRQAALSRTVRLNS